MGSGRWSTDVYDAAARFRAATGASAFAYSDSGAARVHPTLDPHGVRLRESRDSAEHPQSLAIAVLFDVTGSMRRVPRTLQAKLPQLLGLLLRKGYVAHPQIMFGAIGDATCDRAPLQIGQFESDNRMDDDLGRILLEGGGGGQKTESYELALYFMARHTATDCYERRGKRGYLFIIGDEMAYSRVKPAEVRGVIGDELGEPLPVAGLMAEVSAKWDTYYVLPAGASYVGDQEVLGFWRDLLGQNVIELADLDAVCETIALTVGLGEDAISLDDGLADLGDVGSAAGPAVSNALAVIGAGSARLELAAPPPDLDGPSGNVRILGRTAFLGNPGYRRQQSLRIIKEIPHPDVAVVAKQTPYALPTALPPLSRAAGVIVIDMPTSFATRVSLPAPQDTPMLRQTRGAHRNLVV